MSFVVVDLFSIVSSVCSHRKRRVPKYGAHSDPGFTLAASAWDVLDWTSLHPDRSPSATNREALPLPPGSCYGSFHDLAFDQSAPAGVSRKQAGRRGVGPSRFPESAST